MKSSSNTIKPGEKLPLRNGVHPLVKRRFWTFNGMGKGDTILLAHKGVRYIWQAKPDIIDWREYGRRKDLDK